MNRTVFIVWLLVFFLALVAGWSVHAHGMVILFLIICVGRTNYGNCYVESDWIRGWYDKLRHTEPQLTEPQLAEDSRQEGWRNIVKRDRLFWATQLCRRRTKLARRKRRARRIKHVMSNLSG